MSTVKKILLGMIPCLLATSIAAESDNAASETSILASDIKNMFQVLELGNNLPAISDISNFMIPGQDIKIEKLQLSSMYNYETDKLTAKKIMECMQNIKSDAMKRVAMTKTLKNPAMLSSMRLVDLVGWANVLCGHEYVENYINGLLSDNKISFKDISKPNKMKSYYIDMIILMSDQSVRQNLNELSYACQLAGQKSDLTPKELIVLKNNILAIVALANVATNADIYEDNSSKSDDSLSASKNNSPYKINNLIANKAARETVKKYLAHRLQVFDEKVAKSENNKALADNSLTASISTTTSSVLENSTESVSDIQHSSTESVVLENSTESVSDIKQGVRTKINRISNSNVLKINAPLREHKSKVHGYAIAHHWFDTNKSSLSIKNASQVSATPLVDHLVDKLDDSAIRVHAKDVALSLSEVKNSTATLKSLFHMLGQSTSSKLEMLTNEINHIDQLRGILNDGKEKRSLLQVLNISVIAAMAKDNNFSEKAKANNVAYLFNVDQLQRDCAKLISEYCLDYAHQETLSNVANRITNIAPTDNLALSAMWHFGTMMQSIILENNKFTAMNDYFKKSANLSKKVLDVVVDFANDTKDVAEIQDTNGNADFGREFSNIINMASDFINKSTDITSKV